jgi:Na+-driven multidrug efflux pump
MGSRKASHGVGSAAGGDSRSQKRIIPPAASEDATMRFDLGHELKQLLGIAFPSVALQFNMYVVFPQAASEVGRVLGTEELAGFSLGCLVGNITCLSILVGVLTAADTLMPRAYGAERYAEVGRLTIRAVLVCAFLLLPPIIPLCTVMEPMMILLGQDPVAAKLAASWIRVYLLGVPANLLLRTLQRFLVAQSLPWPHVHATTIPSLVIFPVLLRFLVARMGFLGSAAAIAIVQWLMLLILLAYLRLRPVYRKETWPGLSWPFFCEAVRPKKLREFASLSLGGVMSLSEWWFWETMCFVAGTFGTVAFCAHSIAYNLIPLLFMIPLGTSTCIVPIADGVLIDEIRWLTFVYWLSEIYAGCSIGVTVRVGQVLGSDPDRAKLIATWSLALIFVVGGIVASILYVFEDLFVALFTRDPDVFYSCHQIWFLVCIHIWIMFVFGLQSAILRGTWLYDARLYSPLVLIRSLFCSLGNAMASSYVPGWLALGSPSSWNLVVCRPQSRGLGSSMDFTSCWLRMLAGALATFLQ